MSKITKIECNNLLEKLKKYLQSKGLQSSGTSITIEDEELWSIIIAVPSKTFSMSKCSNKTINDYISCFFDEVGVDEDRWVFFGEDKDTNCLEWYLTHPDTPNEIKVMMDEDDERKESELKEKQEKEYKKSLENYVLPTPNKQKAKGDTCYLVLKKCYFEEIESGDKKVEFRELNQYYADKLLGKETPLKFVKFQLGYGGDGHVLPRQMIFKIESIVLVDDYMDEFPAYVNGNVTAKKDLPKDFTPTMYGIKLGERVN